MPSLSVGIPTPGRKSILMTISSILAQEIQPDDDLYIVSDGPAAPWLKDLVASLGPQWRMVETPRVNSGVGTEIGAFGSGARQRVIEEARGDLIVYMDDDDVFTDGAFAAIRKAAVENPGRPMVFRFMIFPTEAGNPQVIWDDGLKGKIIESAIAGHQFVAPNVLGRVGRCMSNRRLYDYEYIRSTVDLYPNKEGDVVWKEALIGVWNPALDIPDRIEPYAPTLEA